MIRLAPFIIVSMFMHGILLVAEVPWSDPLTLPGLPEGSEELLFVEVVAEKEQLAVAPTPAAIDAAASEASEPEKEVHEEEEKPEEPEREPVVEDNALPQQVLATPSEEPKADFVESDLYVPDPPEPVEKLEEQKKPVETKEEKKQEEEAAQESPRAVTSIPQVASRQSVFRASRGTDLANFKAKVLAAIKKASYYPRKAARKRKRGEVVVRFKIWKAGRVDDIEVAHSSGSKILDEAAEKILQEASGDFPSLPEFFRGDHVVYAVPIVFRGKLKVRN